MKKSTWFLWGTLVMVAAFSLALAGCPTEGGDGDSGGDPAAAEQLAADINNMSAGSATVNGAAVTLRGRLSLESPFTVPAGVTLDLTGDGAALELQDGAVLTVNGTVNALGHGDRGNGWVEGGLRIGDGRAVIAGSGTIQLKGKWQLLRVQSNGDGPNKTLTLDGVTLVGVADNNESLVGVHGGGTLVMKSGKITGNTNIRDEWSSEGGGVSVYGGGTFTMEGGEIYENTAKKGSGGGVYIRNSTFTMKDGAISRNIAQGGEWAQGGGVSVTEGSTFTMGGGTIYGNTIKGDHGGGGGVSVTGDSTFTMEGGTIYGKSDGLPPGTDPSLANSAPEASALRVREGAVTANWGIGGKYTKGGVEQTGGSDIEETDDTLIAIPAN